LLSSKLKWYNCETPFVPTEETIPPIVTEQTNNLLTNIPTEMENHDVMFALNKEGASGPSGFGAIFFHTYWSNLKADVINVVMKFISKGWLLPNYNSNTIVLIPKSPTDDFVNQFKPIALANFKFKIITRIIADRLAAIMPHLISKEQIRFIRSRQIRDCICTTFEAVNMLSNKAFGGNITFKIDIAKAFDTLDWSFLLRVLTTFGFTPKFCDWIDVILRSAKLSFFVNGKQHGFFSCNRG